jgi:hypothetical protein
MRHPTTTCPRTALVSQQEDVMMAIRQHQRTADGVTSAVATWYECATNGDTAVIALPVSLTLWLVHRPEVMF